MANTQVRLGLVFEGGVSLAVWMSGVAHEIDRRTLRARPACLGVISPARCPLEPLE